MFTPKLIITDLDGTALRNDKTISNETLRAFKHCKDAGIPIAIATARYIYGARPFANALHADFQILTDGTLVYENDTLIYSNAMDIDTTNKILYELYQNGYTTHIAIPTTHGLYRYPEGSHLSIGNTRNPSKFSDANAVNANGNTIGYHFDIEKHFPYPANKMVVELPDEACAIEIASKCHCSQFHYRGENRYTFYHTSASKLNAIEFIVHKLGITLQDVIVFGDDINDIEMIAHCGYGVAMGNALDKVKSVASEVTDTNENNGIAKVLERFYK